jgi:hypothetical protein
MRATLRTLHVVASCVIALSACGNRPQAITVHDWGPRETAAGKAFNAQPDGLAAFWVKTDGATPSTVLVLAGRKLPSFVTADGKLVTANLPGDLSELYAKPGTYRFFLQDTDSGYRTDEAAFVVK